jgi:hypothetical protein
MIYEWKSEAGLRNFGDALYSEIYSDDFLNFCRSNEKYVFFLIGSLICDDVLDYAKFIDKTPVFIHCGWNGRLLTKEKALSAIYIGYRGDETRRKLEELGIAVEGFLDPIYGLNVLDFPIEKSTGKTFFAPHISEISILTDPTVFGCTDLLSPEIVDDYDLGLLISKVKSADFVLSGSMHVAMLAHLLGIPFGLFAREETKFVDHPIKWTDWLCSFKVNREEVRFVSNLNSAQNWYLEVGKRLESNLANLDMTKIELSSLITVLTHEFTQKLDELTQQRDELTQQRDELTQQRDELTQQRDELTQQRDELIAELGAAVAERDRIAQALTSERDQIEADRDAANAKLEAVVNSRIWRFTKFYRESRLRRPKR